ncbi:lysophospholipase,putative [Plasmodium sp. gorilla clade G2]|uniref:lysophospholipase,putative n=1 Tax=Plasmodium sp. gorilla clade G2 TaxID=880535 RepID=UPI000D21056A|nr:lysophospholipase,putative [Plasmodium sp. gorilla clade G2]SOV19976.1 lysophospholipase,putative [Plasmodium sp. gorilla clade G2]
MMVENEVSPETKLQTQDYVDGAPQIDSFYNKEGLLIRTYSWIVKNAIGILILIHGLNSHMRLQYLRQNAEIVSNDKAILKDENNYYVYKDSWIENLNNNGYSVYGLDLQGHGESEGWENLKTNIKEFDDLVYDVIQYLNKIQDIVCLESGEYCRIREEENMMMESYVNREKKIPIYIMGISMGGNIVLRLLELLGKSKDLNNNLHINGCITLSSMISIDKLVSTNSFKYKHIYLPLTKFLSTHFPKRRLIKRFKFSKHPYVNDLILFDKIRFHKWITCRFGYEIIKAIDNLKIDMEYIPRDIPILFIHSKDDCVCYYTGVENFYREMINYRKEFITLYDMDHMITMEPGNEYVIGKIIEWLLKL